MFSIRKKQKSFSVERLESHDIEYRMRTRDGRYKWIHDHAKVVSRDDAGNPLRMCGTHRDITDRKMLEEERDLLLEQLEDAIKEIRELKGIIPVCSNCHKPLEDSDAWEKIEKYIEKYSDAHFSHGLCVSCMTELYGDKPWYKNREK